MNDTDKVRATDAMLDAIRLVQATVHGDADAYNAVVRTSAASTADIVLALCSILAAAAGAHDDPDESIRELRRLMVNAVMAT